MKKDMDLLEEIEEILPQTQCGQCAFAGCRPYAEALANGEAAINRCPPGGIKGIQKLAKLLQVPVIAYDGSVPLPKPRGWAVIDESTCIGCTLCIKACPVDAILGTSKRMHTVIQDECTGCELCVAPCPVDCIQMIELEEMACLNPDSLWGKSFLNNQHSLEYEQEYLQQQQAKRARSRYKFRNERLARELKEREQRLAAKTQSKAAALGNGSGPLQKNLET
jgi:electron transport complex protein RnfB